jgi:hypothetical protein
MGSDPDQAGRLDGKDASRIQVVPKGSEEGLSKAPPDEQACMFVGVPPCQVHAVELSKLVAPSTFVVHQLTRMNVVILVRRFDSQQHCYSFVFYTRNNIVTRLFFTLATILLLVCFLHVCFLHSQQYCYSCVFSSLFLHSQQYCYSFVFYTCNNIVTRLFLHE